MPSLSPEKLFVVLVVALILVGPNKLPRLARQLGAGWRQLRTFHHRVEQELRETLPNLPSTQDIARFARSPISVLDSLADAQDQQATTEVSAGHSPQGRPPEPGSDGNQRGASPDATATIEGSGTTGSDLIAPRTNGHWGPTPSRTAVDWRPERSGFLGDPNMN